MRHTYNDVIRSTTRDYLQKIQKNNPPTPDVIEEEILDQTASAIRMENSIREKGEKWKIPQKLEFSQIADIMSYLYPIYTVCTSTESEERRYDLLAIYQTSGKNEGIYVTDEEEFRSIARQYNYSLSTREFTEIMNTLRNSVPRVKRTRDKNLIAVNNGIFDYDTKTLMPFDPKYVFLSKSTVNYNPNAKNVVIHNPNDGTDWDVESWIKTLSNDPDVQLLLWQMIGAIIRPNVSWNKSGWFYSESGNNGKGTLCELMRQICGESNYASIPLSDMGKDFALEPLVRASAIIVDENDVGTFIDKAANLKAIITGDTIAITRKFKMNIKYRFRGFMIQCLNEMPRVKDKSDSFFRRQLFVPFPNSFKGIERKYIKDDYLHRTEVLEYVLYKVLNMDYYELIEPEICKSALEEYKEFNNPIKQFAQDILPQAKWDLLPYSFLYDLYKSWFERNRPSGTIQSSMTFKKDLYSIVNDNFPEWQGADRDARIRPGLRMSETEPMIEEYDLKDWMNPRYKQSGRAELVGKCTLPDYLLKDKYQGLLRVTSTQSDT